MNHSKTLIQAGRLLLLASLFLLPTQAWARRTRTDKIRVKTGIEVLKAQHFRSLQGKRVGLITNPTGVDNTLRSTIDLLYEAPGVQLVALYGPEHGVRGNQHAGESVTDVRDEATGLPIHSLYGKTRKATPEMVRGLDALVYDIQDIGCRSYTYISTMGLAMEVAAEQDLEFIVLDRPNPLGGWRVEGCLTEDDCTSFVSQFPIPYVYGLTCGELARLLNGERMLSGGKACRLTVVPMKGWHRDMTYADTGLQWIPASPHIPQPASAIAYPMSGIIGELSYLNIGVGYTIPFQMSTVEFFTLVKNSLAPGGVMVVNMNMHSDKKGSINEYLCDTIASVFGNVYTVKVDSTTNRELFASDLTGMPDRLYSASQKLVDPELKELMEDIYMDMERYEGGENILTDDKAPVELLGMQVIDDLISEELTYYKKRFKEDGIAGLIN